MSVVRRGQEGICGKELSATSRNCDDAESRATAQGRERSWDGSERSDGLYMKRRALRCKGLFVLKD